MGSLHISVVLLRHDLQTWISFLKHQIFFNHSPMLIFFLYKRKTIIYRSYIKKKRKEPILSEHYSVSFIDVKQFTVIDMHYFYEYFFPFNLSVNEQNIIFPEFSFLTYSMRYSISESKSVYIHDCTIYIINTLTNYKNITNFCSSNFIRI